MRRIDITGQVFNYLTALEYSHTYQTHAYWLFECACGERITTSANTVRRGNTTSCGCQKRERAGLLNLTHGGSCGEHVRIYRIWAQMKNRCQSDKVATYPYYGGRGITVCQEWSDSFDAFRDWALANGYSDELTIDREDNDGNYEPGNCRWVTQVVQNNNRRSNRIINYLGMDMTLSEYISSTGINGPVLRRRLDLGMSPELAAIKPVRERKKW